MVILSEVANLIIPGAGSSRAPASMAAALEADETGSLTDVAELLRQWGKTDAPVLTAASLKQEERRRPEAFSALVRLVYEGYYTDPDIIAELGLPGPPQPAGHAMEPFDRTLLDPVEKNWSR